MLAWSPGYKQPCLPLPSPCGCLARVWLMLRWQDPRYVAYRVRYDCCPHADCMVTGHPSTQGWMASGHLSSKSVGKLLPCIHVDAESVRALLHIG
jgi:hypothetical protein